MEEYDENEYGGEENEFGEYDDTTIGEEENEVGEYDDTTIGEEYEQEEPQYDVGFKDLERLNVMGRGEQQELKTYISEGKMSSGLLEEEEKNTAKNMFNRILFKIKANHNISDWIYDRTIALTKKMGNNVRFKNPIAILFSLLLVDVEGKIQSKSSEREKVYEIAKMENIDTPDLLRYCFYVSNLIKSKE